MDSNNYVDGGGIARENKIIIGGITMSPTLL